MISRWSIKVDLLHMLINKSTFYTCTAFHRLSLLDQQWTPGENYHYFGGNCCFFGENYCDKELLWRIVTNNEHLVRRWNYLDKNYDDDWTNSEHLVIIVIFLVRIIVIKNYYYDLWMIMIIVVIMIRIMTNSEHLVRIIMIKNYLIVYDDNSHANKEW